MFDKDGEAGCGRRYNQNMDVIYTDINGITLLKMHKRDMHQQTNIGMTAQVFHKLNLFTCVLKLKKRPLQKAYLRDIESS